MRKFLVYSLKDKKGEVFYIGSTINPKTRLYLHRQVHGKAIEMEIIEESIGSKEDMFVLESKYINEYRNMGVLLINKRAPKGEQKDLIQSKLRRGTYEKLKIESVRRGATISETVDVLLYNLLCK